MSSLFPVNIPASDAVPTKKRKRRANRIHRLGEETMRPCSRCKEKGLLCRVHISSGKCSHCHLSNCRSCDAKVTEVEWKKLGDQRRKLLSDLDRAKEALAEAGRLRAAAFEKEMEAHAKEMRLRKQLDAVDRKVEEGRSLEEREMEEEEEEERALERAGLLLAPDPSDGPMLSPFTWSNWEGNANSEFWNFLDVPVSNPVGNSSPSNQEAAV